MYFCSENVRACMFFLLLKCVCVYVSTATELYSQISLWFVKASENSFFFFQAAERCVFVFVCVNVCVRVCGVRLSVGSMCKPDLSSCKTVNAEKSGKR